MERLGNAFLSSTAVAGARSCCSGARYSGDGGAGQRALADKIEMPAAASRDEVQPAGGREQPFLADVEVKKVIVVPSVW